MYQGLPRGATFCCIYSNKRKFNTLHISFLSLSHIFQWTLEALTEIIFHHIFGTIEWILLKCICPVPVQYNFHCALLLLLLHPIAVVNQAPLQQLFSLPVSRSCIAILRISQLVICAINTHCFDTWSNHHSAVKSCLGLFVSNILKPDN